MCGIDFWEEAVNSEIARRGIVISATDVNFERGSSRYGNGFGFDNRSPQCPSPKSFSVSVPWENPLARAIHIHSSRSERRILLQSRLVILWVSRCWTPFRLRIRCFDAASGHICGHYSTLPSSHVISTGLETTSERAIVYGGFADVWGGILGSEKVCVKVLRIRPAHEGGHKSALEVRDIRDFLYFSLALMLSKPFYREPVVWKRLRHPNVVPFLGVTMTQLQLVSEWMTNGTLTEYVNMKPHVDRISLVSLLPHRIVDRTEFR